MFVVTASFAGRKDSTRHSRRGYFVHGRQGCECTCRQVLIHTMSAVCTAYVHSVVTACWQQQANNTDTSLSLSLCLCLCLSVCLPLCQPVDVHVRRGTVQQRRRVHRRSRSRRVHAAAAQANPNCTTLNCYCRGSDGSIVFGIVVKFFLFLCEHGNS